MSSPSLIWKVSCTQQIMSLGMLLLINLISRSMQGDSNISEIAHYSDLNDQVMIGLASPVLDSTGIPKGVLYGLYSRQHFAEIIDSEISDGKSFTNIINKDGDYISISDHVLNVFAIR